MTAVRTTKGPRLAVHVVDTFDSVLEIVLELGSKDDWRKIRFGPSFNGIYWDLTIIQWDLLGFNHHLIGFNGIKWGHNGFYPPVMMDFSIAMFDDRRETIGDVYSLKRSSRAIISDRSKSIDSFTSHIIDGVYGCSFCCNMVQFLLPPLQKKHARKHQHVVTWIFSQPWTILGYQSRWCLWMVIPPSTKLIDLDQGL